MLDNQILFVTLYLIVGLFAGSHLAFDDVAEEHQNPTFTEAQIPLPKDKILLKSVKTLIFYRNKRTTSRRTHSIHQLACVGGTAGCRLFTPEVVECTNIGFDKDKIKFDWKCHAEISDRVTFKHVDVICEGYDYPEDDYILLGSCGLEFTLDYKDPHDAHQKSYYQHMDEHEKEMHHERVRATAKPRSAASSYIGYQFLEQLIRSVTEHIFLIGVFLLSALCSFLVVRLISSGKEDKNQHRESKKQASGPHRSSGYGPLSPANMTTKKAC